MHLRDQLSRLEGGARNDLLRKAATFLAFDFEAAVRLRSWEDTLGLLEVNFMIQRFTISLIRSRIHRFRLRLNCIVLLQI